MFGKKGKAEKSEATEKPAAVEKPSKGKKSKGSSSGKSGPNVLALHIEKIILAVVVCAAGYVAYDGFSRPGYPPDRNPEALNRSAGDVLRQISEDHWPAIAAEREIKTAFVPEVEKSRKATGAEDYAIGPMRESAGQSATLRGDPKLIAPEQLIAKCVAGALAVEVPKETPDPLDVYENAPQITKNKQKKTPKPGEEEEDEDAIKPPARRLMSKYDLGAPLGAIISTGGEMGGMGGMGMGGEMGPMAGGGMGGKGMGGMGGEMGMGPGGAPGGNAGGLGNNKDTGPKTKVGSQGAIFIAATALVRHKEMFEEYERQFKTSGDYNLRRDTPAYLSFEVQRVDVSKDPNREVQENEWQSITDAGKQLALVKRNKWAIIPPTGRPVPEIIDMNARHPALTMPIPPMLVKDYREFCKHPAINWVWDTKMLIAPPKRDGKKKDKDQDEEENTMPGQGANSMAGMGGMEGGMGGKGMGMGMGGGMGMGMGGEYGSDMYGGGEGGDMYGGMGYGGEGSSDMYGGMGGMGYGGEGGMGMGGMGGMGMGGEGGMGAGMSLGPQPDYKMIRFYDMLTAQDIGKVYRYRVRLVMRDPNYPERDFKTNTQDFLPAPQPRSLQKEVFDRVSEVRKKDDAAYEKDKKARRTLLRTDWSSPCDPVRVSVPSANFAGLGFDPASNPRPSAVSTDGEVNVVATVLDPATGATWAKSFSSARRGSVLNAKKERIEFVVPATRAVKEREFAFTSHATILDMRGGEELGASSRRDGDPLAAMGEAMIMLQDGTIQFTNDIDDTFEYRMYTFADEHENARRMPGDGSGMGGEGGMMGGEGGMMGGEGGMMGGEGGGMNKGGRRGR